MDHLEDLADFAKDVLADRKGKGLAYIDPETGERVPDVAEDVSTYGDKKENAREK